MYQFYNFRKILIFFTGGMVMKACTVIIQNSEGLHARPATFFIQKANSYASTLWIAKDPEKARLAAEGKLVSGSIDTFENGDGVRKINAKSLLGVLSLGIAKGDVVTLIADGADEDEALAGLSALIDGGCKA